MKKFDKSLLVILDGWGHGANPEVSAITQAKTPFVDSLYEKYPNAELITYGEEVGLPEGQMGNSEVGHLNIGAGRVVYQSLAKINKAIKENTLATQPNLQKAIAAAKSGKKLHILGLLSDGGVHAHINHLKALVDITEAEGLSDVYVHAFLDGRDTDPKSGKGYVSDYLSFLDGKQAKLASVVGRYFAMDRDNRWERVKKAYDLLVHGTGAKSSDAVASITESYAAGVTDEFFEPVALTDSSDQPIAVIEPGDVVLFANFRTDRPRELTKALVEENIDEVGMTTIDVDFYTMTQYDEKFKNVTVIFDTDELRNTLGEVIASNDLTQVRIAETEKYPHVSFFFSGGEETPFKGEDRILIPSPKVATYDLQPEMSAPEVTEAIVNKINADQPNFICLNYANTDMVGHTGDFDACMKSAETVDKGLSELIETALKHDYACFVIADHGNCDYMKNPDGSPNTAHTTNPVPFFFVANDTKGIEVKNGKLADIAPSILAAMQLDIPSEMDGDIIVKTTVNA